MNTFSSKEKVFAARHEGIQRTKNKNEDAIIFTEQALEGLERMLTSLEKATGDRPLLTGTKRKPAKCITGKFIIAENSVFEIKSTIGIMKNRTTPFACDSLCMGQVIAP